MGFFGVIFCFGGFCLFIYCCLVSCWFLFVLVGLWVFFSFLSSSGVAELAVSRIFKSFEQIWLNLAESKRHWEGKKDFGEE